MNSAHKRPNNLPTLNLFESNQNEQSSYFLRINEHTDEWDSERDRTFADSQYSSLRLIMDLSYPPGTVALLNQVVAKRVRVLGLRPQSGTGIIVFRCHEIN